MTSASEQAWDQAAKCRRLAATCLTEAARLVLDELSNRFEESAQRIARDPRGRAPDPFAWWPS